MSEWQPRDTAPKDGTRFLAKQGENIWVAKFYTEKNPHPMNGQWGFTSVICDCCEIFSTYDFDVWKPVDE